MAPEASVILAVLTVRNAIVNLWFFGPAEGCVGIPRGESLWPQKNPGERVGAALEGETE